MIMRQNDEYSQDLNQKLQTLAECASGQKSICIQEGRESVIQLPTKQRTEVMYVPESSTNCLAASAGQIVNNSETELNQASDKNENVICCYTSMPKLVFDAEEKEASEKKEEAQKEIVIETDISDDSETEANEKQSVHPKSPPTMRSLKEELRLTSDEESNLPSRAGTPLPSISLKSDNKLQKSEDKESEENKEKEEEKGSHDEEIKESDKETQTVEEDAVEEGSDVLMKEREEVTEVDKEVQTDKESPPAYAGESPCNQSKLDTEEQGTKTTFIEAERIESDGEDNDDTETSTVNDEEITTKRDSDNEVESTKFSERISEDMESDKRKCASPLTTLVAVKDQPVLIEELSKDNFEKLSRLSDNLENNISASNTMKNVLMQVAEISSTYKLDENLEIEKFDNEVNSFSSVKAQCAESGARESPLPSVDLGS